VHLSDKSEKLNNILNLAYYDNYCPRVEHFLIIFALNTDYCFSRNAVGNKYQETSIGKFVICLFANENKIESIYGNRKHTAATSTEFCNIYISRVCASADICNIFKNKQNMNLYGIHKKTIICTLHTFRGLWRIEKPIKNWVS